MRSVLPERYLAQDRRSRKHITFACCSFVAFFSAIALLVPLLSRYAPLAHRHDFAIGYLCLVGAGVFMGAYRIFQHDKAM
jgi:hypothetical protein